jgi:hypothetical protein
VPTDRLSLAHCPDTDACEEIAGKTVSPGPNEIDLELGSASVVARFLLSSGVDEVLGAASVDTAATCFTLEIAARGGAWSFDAMTAY